MISEKVLGTRVDLVSKDQALETIQRWIGDKADVPKIVVTAYSEFFVVARSSVDFRMALEGSDLVVPDGVGPLAAIHYRELISDFKFDILYLRRILAGLKTGLDVLRGKIGETVSGYWLFGELTRIAAERGWRVFVLGGFGDTAEKLTKKLKIVPTKSWILGKAGKNCKLKIEFDAGAQTVAQMDSEANEMVIEKINRFKPDLLFVAYGPINQEIWLAKNRNKLKVKVAIGVGGTFDEFLGKVKEAPTVFSHLGLKWLWRLIQQPRRFRRIFRAVIVFPWLVFRSGIDAQHPKD